MKLVYNLKFNPLYKRSEGILSYDRLTSYNFMSKKVLKPRPPFHHLHFLASKVLSSTCAQIRKRSTNDNYSNHLFHTLQLIKMIDSSNQQTHARHYHCETHNPGSKAFGAPNFICCKCPSPFQLFCFKEIKHEAGHNCRECKA